MTWQEYETDLDEKLADLHRRIHRGRIERNLPREPTFRKPMDGNVPWASPPWRIRSFSMR